LAALAASVYEGNNLAAAARLHHKAIVVEEENLQAVQLPQCLDEEEEEESNRATRLYVSDLLALGIYFEKGRTGHGVSDISYYGLFQPSLLQ
jgi:hypothetical protein